MYVVRRLEKMRTSNIKNRQKYEYEGRTFKKSNSWSAFFGQGIQQENKKQKEKWVHLGRVAVWSKGNITGASKDETKMSRL